MKTHIQRASMAIFFLVLLSACGSEGKKTVIANGSIIEECSTDEATPLDKGNQIVALEKDTEIEFTHTQDGQKKACTLVGKAKIML